jgi:hypothetical protein
MCCCSSLLLTKYATISFCAAAEAPKLANRKTKAELEGMTEDEQVGGYGGTVAMLSLR